MTNTDLVDHPSDIEAAVKMAQLFDCLLKTNKLASIKNREAMNVFLSRILFCFYAESTGIFKDNQVTQAVASCTKDDGSDVNEFLDALFLALDTPIGSPNRSELSTGIKAFPYVNGGLFKSKIATPSFSKNARCILIECGSLDWQKINPDIFGSMFQAVINSNQRGNLGQHYTSVPNIMKLIKPLFLDDLYQELNKSRKSAKRLHSLLIRLENIRIFDPAAGSANFLCIAYKELRVFEMEVIDAINTISNQQVMYYSGISLTQFYGIEIDGFAYQLAVLSLWLVEHQMNVAFEDKFGYSEPALPLRASGSIVLGNSLQMDWNKVCATTSRAGAPYEVYVCGNPPFLGWGVRDALQNKDMDTVFKGFKRHRFLDYVGCFFWKGAQYIKNNGSLAFVSTNSICQGEQVAMLWPHIFDLGLSISFAHQSFPWANNAKDKAKVHVVIVGLSSQKKNKIIYSLVNDQTTSVSVKNISPYLLAGSSICVASRPKPLSDVSVMTVGNVAKDGGGLVLDKAERFNIIESNPAAAAWIKPYIGGFEFVNSKERYCLWLVDATEADIDAMPLVKERLDIVRKMRLASDKADTRNHAATPHLFVEKMRQPTEGNYIIIPYTSSERRHYIPLGFIDSGTIASNSVNIISGATLYEFGVLTSAMHNDWMRVVGSRMKSDYRYAGTIVYNTFPWADTTESQRMAIEVLASKILSIRSGYSERTLGQIYDPDKMPEQLLAAHKALDKAVDIIYSGKPFKGASERMEHLFGRYETLISIENEISTINKTGRRRRAIV